MKLAAFAFCVLLLAGCSRQPAPVESQPAAEAAPSRVVVLPAELLAENGIATAPVTRKAVKESVQATARITNDENNTWRVGAITEGRITRVLANPGDAIQKDQILARMHSHEIHESRAVYKRAKADLERLKGIAEFSLRQRDRAQRLHALKAGSLVQLEQKETELRNAETDVRNAMVELERTRVHLEDVLEIPAEPAASDDESADLIPIRAPAAGVVLTRSVTPGTVVSPASDLFLISNLASLWAMAELNEEHLGRLRTGMAARVSVQAYPGEVFPGRIGRLGEALNPDTRTIRVRVDLPNSRGRLKPEMYATVEIELGAGSAVLAVPSEAVQHVRGQPCVFVQTAPGTFEVRAVQLGRSLDNSYEIASGLAGNEVIAVRGAFVLKSQYLKSTLAD